MNLKPMSKSVASIEKNACVACGCCLKVCPRQALAIWKGSYAAVDENLCVGCGKCEKECPASVIHILPRTGAAIEAAAAGAPERSSLS